MKKTLVSRQDKALMNALRKLAAKHGGMERVMRYAESIIKVDAEMKAKVATR